MQNLKLKGDFKIQEVTSKLNTPTESSVLVYNEFGQVGKSDNRCKGLASTKSKAIIFYYILLLRMADMQL